MLFARSMKWRKPIILVNPSDADKTFRFDLWMNDARIIGKRLNHKFIISAHLQWNINCWFRSFKCVGNYRSKYSWRHSSVCGLFVQHYLQVNPRGKKMGNKYLTRKEIWLIKCHSPIECVSLFSMFLIITISPMIAEHLTSFLHIVNF